MPDPRYLFSERALIDLQRFVTADTLLSFDLDGTLVPLVDDFNKVKLASEARASLVHLMKNYSVAVVSGRARRDLRKVVPMRGLHLIGNHGLESLSQSLKSADVDRWKRQISLAVAGIEGVLVEDKRLSLSVHYRNSPRKPLVRRRVLKTLPELKPAVRVITGKSIFNILPDFGQHKGTAVLSLMKDLRCKNAFFIGDDVTDEDVFRMNNRRLFTVRVGGSRSTAAKYFVRGQDEVSRLLHWLESL